MSTRSNIGYKNEDGMYSYVYSHFDGYLDGVGNALKLKYNNKDSAVSLVEAGDMSFPGTHYTNRGESYEDNKPRHTENRKDIFEQEFAYVWEDGKWIYTEDGEEWLDL